MKMLLLLHFDFVLVSSVDEDAVESKNALLRILGVLRRQIYQPTKKEGYVHSILHATSIYRLLETLEYSRRFVKTKVDDAIID
jgi:hypothetical protein